MDRADYQQQELERERITLTLEALEAARKGEATQEQIEHLARECGIKRYIARGNQNEMV